MTRSIVGALLIAAAVPVAGQAPGGTAGVKAPPAASPSRAAGPADRRQENKALVRRYLTEVLAAGNAGHLDEIVARNFADRSPGAANLHGADAVREIQKRLHSVFAKLEYDPQDLVAEGDRVAARYLILGTPRPEPRQPAPPPILINGLAFFRLRAGRIQEVFVVNDQITLLRQLGYSLVPPGSAASLPPPSAARPTPPATAAHPTSPPTARPTPPASSSPTPSSPPPAGPPPA
jgi:predicted ester cyclase